MTAREWKPGDVAMIRIPKSSAPGFAASERGYADVAAIRNTAGGWNALADPDYFWAADYTFHNVPPRPLVVIDADDREQVERLTNALETHILSSDDYADGVQAVLREFASPTPPEPDEPQGLGAVVEDAEGVRWTRVESGDAVTRNPWYPANLSELQPEEWSDIAAVRVLSEGVTP